jgi:tetratricopeptide (TPR) repeat protein
MLFDLKGKRRRAVQGTYLTLAILMGAGLVLFGIGSNQQGGLSELFGGGNGSNTATASVQKKIDKAEKALAKNPGDTKALADIVRGHYQLASASSPTDSTKISKKGRGELTKAIEAWEKYLAAEPPKVDTSLAAVAVQAYSTLAQTVTAEADDKPAQEAAAKRYWAGAANATEVIAETKENSQNYLQLVQFATLAGQERKAELAGQKAIALAPKNQKKEAKQAVEQAKSQAQSQSSGGATTTPALPGQ